MKKLKNRQAQIRLAKLRFKKKLKRRVIRKLLNQISYEAQIKFEEASKQRRLFKLKESTDRYKTLVPPEKFSLIKNSDKTIDFFDSLQMLMLKYEPVYVDMTKINYMTVDALVYYIAVLQKLRTKIDMGVLKGSFPEDAKIFKLMQRSGFLRFFQTSGDNIKTDSNFIEIQSGNIADNQVVKKICLFVGSKLKVGRVDTQKLYDIIFEMMLNTKQHAYETEGSNYDNWLLFLRFIPIQNSIDFIFMDTGYGIPKTVTMNKLEKAKVWLSRVGISDYKESDLVQSALHGALRTKTGEGYRGKGLPRIFKAFNDGYIKGLNILSNKACVMEVDKCDLQKEMIGTLFFWKITKESISERIKNL